MKTQNKKVSKQIKDYLNRKNVLRHVIVFTREEQANSNLPEIMNILGSDYKSEKHWNNEFNKKVAYRFTKKTLKYFTNENT